ncbi:3-phosphoshikimate 1-carboxyvinyltransferase [Porphyromonas pogonae]|uniref:3-phosphoshikimate 1-carboxyvinyltransferase n=1 Tax=Porphyromonas pogonae TaxID=867595 RepID=UPI002E76FC42|nr:3-phosphoshikimate 1-carboxyvinyltransferase [Porphyromonas pogonae]
MIRATNGYRLTWANRPIDEVEIILPPSKSIISRQLILRAVSGLPLLDHTMQPAFWSLDNKAILAALSQAAEGVEVISAGESGTAMRLLAAYLAATVQTPTTLCGQGRQHSRIIAPLVEALRCMGADIAYLESEGYPPLRISPAKLCGGRVELDASVSSQFISALLLIAPLLDEDLEIILTNKHRVSEPYAHMTAAMLAQSGCVVAEKGSGYHVRQDQSAISNPLGLEADWTAASYFYAFTALSPSPVTVHLPSLYLDSLQGDCAYVCKLFEAFDIVTHRNDNGVTITRKSDLGADTLTAHMQHCPDLVPTLVSLCICKGVSFVFCGVSALRTKESDRLAVLSQEFAKLGYKLDVKDDEIAWQSSSTIPHKRASEVTIDPANDHRIAMAFALWAFYDEEGIIIQSPEVVNKSFPGFWTEVQKLGITIEER